MCRVTRRRSGFTLVELLVVIVVLAVLAAIVLPKFVNSGARSRESALKADLRELRNAISAFQVDTGKYPNTLADLAETDKTKVRGADGAVVSASGWHGPYVESVPTDPVTGGAFKYDKAAGAVNSAAVGIGPGGVSYGNL
jgi:general secretion pathway protein G